MSRFISLYIFICLLSCTSKNSTQNNSSNHFFNSIELGERNEKLRFYISASFNECGEWGGHQELLEFFGKKGEVFVNYKKSNVDCNRISDLYGKPEFHQWIVNDTIKLNNNHKKAINIYLKNLVESKLSEGIGGHSGRTFAAYKSDSTFNIQVYNYDDDKINTRNYNQLLQSFKLDTIW